LVLKFSARLLPIQMRHAEVDIEVTPTASSNIRIQESSDVEFFMQMMSTIFILFR